MDSNGNNIPWGGTYAEKDEQLKRIARSWAFLKKFKGGWKSLSAKETGRIGGILSRKKKSKTV